MSSYLTVAFHAAVAVYTTGDYILQSSFQYYYYRTCTISLLFNFILYRLRKRMLLNRTSQSFSKYPWKRLHSLRLASSQPASQSAGRASIMIIIIAMLNIQSNLVMFFVSFVCCVVVLQCRLHIECFYVEMVVIHAQKYHCDHMNYCTVWMMHSCTSS